MRENNLLGKVFTTLSPEDTQKLSKDFAKTLESGDVVCLYGDLGSGKTTFTQGLAEGLGIKGRIISPTFVIVRSYKVENNIVILASEARPESKKDPGQARMTDDESSLFFYHIDLYRTVSERDLEGLGIKEIINDKNNIVVIEWAEKLKNLLPKNRIDIEFSQEEDGSRKIMFRSLNQ